VNPFATILKLGDTNQRLTNGTSGCTETLILTIDVRIVAVGLSPVNRSGRVTGYSEEIFTVPEKFGFQ
jgi:hypothetical protein